MKKRVDEEPIPRDQLLAIRSKNRFSTEVANGLFLNPDLTLELSEYLHAEIEPQRTYLDLFDWYFFRSGRSATELLNSPFIKGLLVAEKISENKVSGLKALVAQGEHEVALSNLIELLNIHLEYMLAAFRQLMHKHDLIPQFTEDQKKRIALKNFNSVLEWREKNPTAFAQMQRDKALLPKLWSDEVVAQIQEVFDAADESSKLHHLSAKLASIGIDISPMSLKNLISIQRLRNTPEEKRRTSRSKRRQLVKKAYDRHSGSWKAVLAELGGLYDKSVLKQDLMILEEGTRLKWEEPLELKDGGVVIPVQVLLEVVAEGLESVSLEYEEFCNRLVALGFLDIAERVNENSYKGKRLRTVKSRKSK